MLKFSSDQKNQSTSNLIQRWVAPLSLKLAFPKTNMFHISLQKKGVKSSKTNSVVKTKSGIKLLIN